jgi:hypothetical protein
MVLTLSTLTFNACNKKAFTHISPINKEPIVFEESVTEELGLGGDISMDSVSVSPYVEPIPVSAPVVVSHSRVGSKRRVSADSIRPSVISAPPKSEAHRDTIQSGILTAGDIDDNLNLNYFQGYINRILQSKKENHFPFMSTKGRIKITILGKEGKGMNRIKVKVGDFESHTNSQGVLYLYPSVDNIPTKTEITINNKSEPIDLDSKKEFSITFNKNATLPKSLDIMFVIDSTGSMGDEMRYLTKEFDAIVANIEEKYPQVGVRFGLTLYRDAGDDYVVRDFPFTSNATKMKKQLEKQSANGGGDYPEAMEQGFSKGIDASWSAKDGVRLMFLVADAPPHDEQLKAMLPLIQKARKKGIRLYPIGASGVAEKAEYIMRHMALFTQGRYLWLTDDSGVGKSHAEPKVKCYQVTRLDQLIKRVIESELSGKRVEPKQESIIRTVGQYQNGLCQ